MAVPELDPSEIEQLLADHPTWSLTRDGKAITRTFQFSDFSQAWGFMSRVA
ncbi:MAG: pterin-4-alpha-carbinolamine dehydratase, partial [Erythrobacter sp.]|nr:pterin-4-alpha-carbinolamine dehydratase [Erythrobacter sp.]